MPSLVSGPRCSCLSLAPAISYLDVYLHGNPVGVVSVQPRVEDLIHPGDHDFLYELRDLFGLILGALDDQLVVAGDHELGVEVVGEPFVGEGHS